MTWEWIFVLIIGGRYGSEASAGRTELPKTFYERYNSITREEYGAAVERDIPVYVLIERNVHAEYETYLKNKTNTTIQYAHVDSVNIFELIENILAQPRNNPIQQFDRYSELETWLREQWSGLFHELLQRMKSQAQLAGLQDQVTQLAELNKTLKTYLEEVVAHVAPKKSQTLIRSETKRLEDASLSRRAIKNPLVKYLHGHDVPLELVIEAAGEHSLEAFFDRLIRETESAWLKRSAENLLRHSESVLIDVNELRRVLGLSPLEMSEPPGKKSAKKTPSVRKRKASAAN